ncbi:MAG TPA: hypothetical protein VGM57_01170 [Pseudolabrys sp.]
MAGLLHGVKIARRLIVLFGRRRIDEMIASHVVSHEESIGAGIVAADNPVAFFAAKPDQRFQAGAEIVAAVPSGRRIVRHDEQHRRSQCRIVFDDDNARIDRCYRLPDPIIVVVDIDAEEIDVSRYTGLLAECVDVLSRDQILADRELTAGYERSELLADFGDMGGRSFEL